LVVHYGGQHPFLFIHEITVLGDELHTLRCGVPQCERARKYENAFVKKTGITPDSLAFYAYR
ncbi:MAG: hypothetical protein N0E38_04160, partial [Candidatus Thiodiazotropha endolucinida]|nr:hypothetical protein [Candidatus Thiodiazotropha taylori]MCW4348142.1 hypothetical protein [Candidatus Thiodiazotropha endolucinida]